MKKIYILLIGVLLFSSCSGELDQMPNTETTSADVYTTAANYQSVLAKLYASFIIAGQQKGGTNVDISSNSGYDYMRGYINMQECGTDEMACTWLSGDKLTNLSYLSWDTNDPWVEDTYYRIYQTIAYCNEFLRNASDNAISKFSEDDQKTIKQYSSEARFLRALAYYYALDLYRNIPFVTEKDKVGAYTPPRYTSSQIFSYIESELKDIEATLPGRTSVIYGHVSKAGDWALLAKLYLNAKVYTGTEHYTDCITYCNKIISEGYSLEPNYAKLFNADNDKRVNEIIFAFNIDSEHTVSWGAATYLVCGAVSNTSSYQKSADYGVTTGSGWGSFRARGELPALFSSGDTRAMFFSKGQTQYLNTSLSDATNGYLVTKWTNLTDAGAAASNTAQEGVNTDYPVFRLADVYLMLAESVLRGGTGDTKDDALHYINLLRERAYGGTTGDIKLSDLTTDFILDERARELYWECTRRTDLIRYGKFTTSSYLWQWKGGVKDGQAVDDKYNYYPIPAAELSANPNLYNENY